MLMLNLVHVMSASLFLWSEQPRLVLRVVSGFRQIEVIAITFQLNSIQFTRYYCNALQEMRSNINIPRPLTLLRYRLT